MSQSTCPRCKGTMHHERTVGTKWDESVVLLACYNCGERLDELIHLHRIFSGPQADRRAEAWKKLRRLVAIQKEKAELAHA